MKELGMYLEYEQPNKYIVEDDNYKDEYEIPVLTAGKSFILGYTNEKDGVFPKERLPVIIFDDFTTSTQFVDFQFKVKSSAMKILSCDDKNNIKYFYYLMKNIKFNAETHKRYWISEYSKIKVEEKSLEEQNNIVESLDKISNLIENRKKMINDYNLLIKSKFNELFRNSKYEVKKLEEICDVRDGTHDSPKYLIKSDYKFITSKNIGEDKIDCSDIKYISKEDYDKFNVRSKVNTGDILMPMIGTIGRPLIVDIPDNEIDFAIKNVALIKFYYNSVVTNTYIENLLKSDYFEGIVSKTKRGGTQKFISLSDIRNLEVEIPPIEKQIEFDKFIEKIEVSKMMCQKDIEDLEIILKKKMNYFFVGENK